MMYMPLVWVIIAGTAILSSIITTALPYVPKWWNMLKTRIKRNKIQKTRLQKPYQLLQVEVTQLSKEIEELKEQMDNVAKNHYTRERNRKSNIRRDVREYLKELQND